MEESAQSFLDVPTLLEQSQPQARNGWIRYVGVLLAVFVLSGALVGQQSSELQKTMSFLGSMTMLGLMAGMALLAWQAAQRQRDEQRQLESIEELIQLRRWPQAAMLLGAILSVPARSMAGRVQALLYLSIVLTRYQRFSDAVSVQEHVLDTVQLDDAPAYGVRLSRAMSLLHEDQLLDADRAISELRRLAGSDKPAGLVLVEMYRDVKTGHADEAVELFTRYQVMLRDQLGHRVADAWALVARAYDLLERHAEAAAAYENALMLCAATELQRRYPELLKMSKVSASPSTGS